MEELKPCPFCGGEAKVMDMGYPHWVYCTSCGAKVHGGTTDEKDSIEAWNRRVLQAQDVFGINVGDVISRTNVIDTEGLDEQIRCEMCRNPMHTSRGCDGNCEYDVNLYKRIMQILGERIKPLPSAQPEFAKDTNVPTNDCISRKATIDALNDEIVRRRVSEDTNDDGALDEFDTEAILRRLPSAQPEIIRCKDCKYYLPMNRETKTGICNLTMHQNFGDEWFCAGAERRTDETD